MNADQLMHHPAVLAAVSNADLGLICALHLVVIVLPSLSRVSSCLKVD